MKTEQAIKYFEDEIRFCESAPALNNCQRPGDWLLIREACKAAVEALREKQERENPKPLTIDEMRQMIGEPVWCQVMEPSARCVKNGGGYWAIASGTLMKLIRMHGGITAYRHKPEEVQRD